MTNKITICDMCEIQNLAACTGKITIEGCVDYVSPRKYREAEQLWKNRRDEAKRRGF